MSANELPTHWLAGKVGVARIWGDAMGEAFSSFPRCGAECGARPSCCPLRNRNWATLQNCSGKEDKAPDATVMCG